MESMLVIYLCARIQKAIPLIEQWPKTKNTTGVTTEFTENGYIYIFSDPDSIMIISM